MKEKIIFVFCMFVSMISAQAQKVTVKSPSPNLKVEFKRCIASSDLSYIDITITNTLHQDTKLRWIQNISIYDDEGNIYNNENISGNRFRIFIARSNTDLQPTDYAVDIPAGITYKARFILVNGFDEFATQIQLMKMSFNWNVFNTKIYGEWVTDTFELRNLPITRE